MINVAAITSGRNVPSARFRVRQHVDVLREMGVCIRERIPPIEKYAPAPGWMSRLTQYGCPGFLVECGWRAVKRSARIPGILESRRSQVTWLERLLLPGRLTEEWLLKRPLVFDVDDAIWLFPPGGLHAAAAVGRRADVVVAGNEYIADWFRAHARQVRVIPTAVDTDHYHPGRGSHADGFTVGWIGTSSNLPFLEAIEAPLRRFLEEHPDSRLLVVADRPPMFRAVPRNKVRYIPWSMGGEAEALREMHVGLMPLPDTEWTRGKCSFKMLLYMATGIPAVVSPVGMNREILDIGSVGVGANDDEGWYEALSCYHRDPHRRESDGREGRAIAVQKFGKRIVAKALLQIFRELA